MLKTNVRLAIPLLSILIAGCKAHNAEVPATIPATNQANAQPDDEKNLSDLFGAMGAYFTQRRQYGESPDYHRAFMQIQADVRRLPQKYRRSSVPFLKQRLVEEENAWPSRPFVYVPVAIAALDALEAGQEVGDVLLHSIDVEGWGSTYGSYTGFALLNVSSCSIETRIAVANTIAEHLIKKHWVGQLYFLAMCGDARTADLLMKAEATNPIPDHVHFFADTAAHIRSRLSLSKEQQAQYSHDELLFYQTFYLAPRHHIPRMTYPPAAQQLVARNEKISLAFLQEVLQTNEGDAPEGRKWLALDLIVAQKERNAIPLLKDLASSKQPIATDAQEALKSLEEELNGK